MASVLERSRQAPVAAPVKAGSGELARRVGAGLVLGPALAWLAQGDRRLVPASALGSGLGKAAGQLGRGLVAGIVGTLAITAAGAIEQELRRHAPKQTQAKPTTGPLIAFIWKVHEPWIFGGDAIGQILEVAPKSETGRYRFGIAAHWLYGTTWGIGLGAMRLVGVRGGFAIAGVLAGQLGAEMVLMPAAKLFSPPSKWGRQAIVSSVLDHTAYAIAAGAAFEFLQP